MAKYIPAREVSNRFGFTVGQLSIWRFRKQGPLYRKINGRAYYRMDDVERWLKEQDSKNKL